MTFEFFMFVSAISICLAIEQFINKYENIEEEDYEYEEFEYEKYKKW